MKEVVTIDKCSILNFMYINRFFLLKALGYSVITTVYIELEFENAKEKYPDSFSYFKDLLNSSEISRLSLEIEDLVEMSNIPQSKRASNGELSCFVVAKRIGSKVMTDDTKAIKYIKRHIEMPPNSITQLPEILIEAYLKYHLGDHELKVIQETLGNNKFTIPFNLADEAAKRRWMTGEGN
jgi:predicted nucleic acid-binding protein